MYIHVTFHCMLFTRIYITINHNKIAYIQWYIMENYYIISRLLIYYKIIFICYRCIEIDAKNVFSKCSKIQEWKVKTLYKFYRANKTCDMPFPEIAVYMALHIDYSASR